MGIPIGHVSIGKLGISGYSGAAFEGYDRRDTDLRPMRALVFPIGFFSCLR
jgi:hypothetical protein